MEHHPQCNTRRLGEYVHSVDSQAVLRPCKYTPKVYEVKTRKILRYSNVIASSSNVLYTAISGDLTRIDAGGMLVTLWQLIRDWKFKRDVKAEFISESFNAKIRGDGYGFA